MIADHVQANMPFLAALPAALRAVALPAKAAGMAAYMKSATPFLGVPSPMVRATVRTLAKEHPFTGAAQMSATTLKLWAEAQYREERYAAIMLTDSPVCRGEIELLPFYTTVIEEGQWWDYVDSIAPRLCELLLAHPATMEPLLLAWSQHTNMWFRRASIIAQLAAKTATNTALLEELLVPNLADPQFFIRKASGWALRQYARTDPGWVLDFVARHKNAISSLTYREALKHLI
ncbi:DNA alkylation repair protein [Arthrobacter cryoconiti]|uniref:DNA alkylation repair protein n=1 Tax=Arthrobacter cryoconiti TaxID=748907 RepID=A0ABV8R1J8_9MICC|nr:DNA alkylation repair protein [Arthrobacter cryoconiti]MCC9069868.1 DNA alkylation repair protein [Arthrobacter cryoconiti]